MTVRSFFARSFSTAVFWGILGGLSLVLTAVFTTNGPLQVLPLFLVLCAAILTTKYCQQSGSNFSELFQSGFFAFMISALCQYVYILTVINPGSGIPVSGHLWRLGVIIGIGITGSSLISFLARPVKG